MSRTTFILLQISQRSGAIALLSTLGTWTLLFLDKDISIALTAVAAAADAGLCLALLVRAMSKPETTDRREANSVALFNLVLLTLAFHLMVFTRVDVIRSAAARFFTPPARIDNARMELP